MLWFHRREFKASGKRPYMWQDLEPCYWHIGLECTVKGPEGYSVKVHTNTVQVKAENGERPRIPDDVRRRLETELQRRILQAYKGYN